MIRWNESVSFKCFFLLKFQNVQKKFQHGKMYVFLFQFTTNICIKSKIKFTNG